MSVKLLAAVVLASGVCFAHRLDEYLQAATISLAQDHIVLEVRLTPGVSVAPLILKTIDRNGDGTISEAEQDTCIQRFLTDVSLTLDAHPVTLRLTSKNFPPVEDMREGRGIIQLAFEGQLQSSVTASRELRFQNHHWRAIGAYLVNVLVPADPKMHIATQERNFDQSSYRLTYSQPASRTEYAWLLGASLLAIVRIAFRSGRREESRRGNQECLRHT